MPSANSQIVKTLEDLDKVKKSCVVIISGIDAEREDLAALSEYQNQLIEAIDNLRDRTANLQAISMREFKKIKNEAILMKDIISKKKKSIKILESYLKEESKKEERLQQQLEKLYRMLNGKKILEFRGKR